MPKTRVTAFCSLDTGLSTYLAPEIAGRPYAPSLLIKVHTYRYCGVHLIYECVFCLKAVHFCGTSRIREQGKCFATMKRSYAASNARLATCISIANGDPTVESFMLLQVSVYSNIFFHLSDLGTQPRKGQKDGGIGWCGKRIMRCGRNMSAYILWAKPFGAVLTTATVETGLSPGAGT